MKRIAALIASPRKGGNVDILTTALLNGAAEAGAQTEAIYLIDTNVRPCTQCEACHRPGASACVLADDFAGIADAMARADAIILATPIWWSSMHATLKLVLDRCYSLLDSNWGNFKLSGKQFVLIAAQTQPDVSMYAEALAKEFAVYQDWLKIRLVDHIAVSAEARGEVAQNAEAMEKARRIGRSLALGDRPSLAHE
ncbi:MAG: flavodoxin family protein [Spirochaetes bacterium]|nr:flavodoxin family protein [Spirochaetota bacterium]MBU1078991.1 flavodoxin family protein [Spirochaetota bacterium]